MVYSKKIYSVSKNTLWLEISSYYGYFACLREFLQDLGAEIILSADETFVNFMRLHICMVLVPNGAKNVGTALKTKDKSGCTAMFNKILN